MPPHLPGPFLQNYTSLVAALSDYENSKAEEWARSVEKSSDAKLRLPLLTRDAAAANPQPTANSGASEQSDPGPGPLPISASALLRVNFSPDLVCMLREARYFMLLGQTVPPAAAAVYKRAEAFRAQVGNLELIVNMYNGIDTTMHPVHRPIMKVPLLHLHFRL